MKLEAVEDHTPWNVNRGEKSYRCQTGREEPGEQSLQTEVNVTNTEIRNLIGLKEKKIRVINYSLTWTRALQNLVSPGSFFNYSQPYGILLSIVSDLCHGKPFSLLKEEIFSQIIGLHLLPLIKIDEFIVSQQYLTFLDKQQLFGCHAKTSLMELEDKRSF